MTGVIATIPKHQFLSNGVPMVDGTLETYLAGSTTPEPTYQDQALSIANPVEIVLDSRGECVLWLDSTKQYKFILKNKQGVIQWTQDNVSGAAGWKFVSDLASDSGADMVGYNAGTVKTALDGVAADIVALEADIATLDAGAVASADAIAVESAKTTALSIAATGLSSRPAFIEQHLSGFFGRGMLTSEVVDVITEQAVVGNYAAAVDAIGVTDATYFIVGGCVTIKHDNGRYGTYFVSSKASNNIGIYPALRYACSAATAKIERTWFNRAHPGKYYMRELAQRIALSTELDASMPNGKRVLFTNVSSNPNTLEDTLVATGSAAVAYFAASNLGVSGTVASPVRFALGRSAYVDNILAAGDGAETQFFDVLDIGMAVVKVAFIASPIATRYAVQVFDELGIERGKYIIPNGADHGAARIYSLSADLRGAKRIKVKIACETYAGAGSYFALSQIDVFEAPAATGKIIAKPAAKIVVLGDSWTAGDLVNSAEREPITARLAIELPYATVVNAGVGGNTIVDALARFDADVAPHAPDYVVVHTGTNECYNPLSGTFDPNALDAFVAAYRTVINKILAIGARPIIIGVPAMAQSDAAVPAFPEWQLNDRARAYAKRVFEDQGGLSKVMSGSNANGSWTKFKDGTLICRHTVAVTTTAGSTLAATTWTYPVPFVAAPKVTTAISNYSSNQIVSGGANTPTTTTVPICMVSTSAVTLSQDCVAVGRWY